VSVAFGEFCIRYVGSRLMCSETMRLRRKIIQKIFCVEFLVKTVKELFKSVCICPSVICHCCLNDGRALGLKSTALELLTFEVT